VDSTVGAAADPSVCVAVSPVTDGIDDSAVDAAADLAVSAVDAPTAGGVADSPVDAMADTDVGKASDPADGVVADPAVGTVAALTLDELADLTTWTVANFILTGAACPAFGVTDDTTFDVVAKEEVDSVGNGNENIKTSNLTKKDRNMRRTAEMR